MPIFAYGDRSDGLAGEIVDLARHEVRKGGVLAEDEELALLGHQAGGAGVAGHGHNALLFHPGHLLHTTLRSQRECNTVGKKAALPVATKYW